MKLNHIWNLATGLLLATSMCLLFAPAAFAQEASPRERALQDKLMGACCWAETIAYHRSETAMEQRLELARLIKEGRTDREILDWFKAKYGARVLVEPEGSLSLTAYTLPAVAALLGLACVVLVLRRWVRRSAADAGSSEAGQT